MRHALFITIVIGLATAACDKGGDKGPAGSASSTSASSAGTTSITKEQLDAAEKLTDPDKIDASNEKVTAKLGKPQKVEGDKNIWYAADKGNCYRLVISKTKGIESGTTDKSSCGLK